MNFVLLLPFTKLTSQLRLGGDLRIRRIILRRIDGCDVLLDEAFDAVVLGLVFVGVLHDLGRRLKTRPAIALLKHVDELAKEALGPHLGLHLNLKRLIQGLLIRSLGNRNELVGEIHNRKTTPGAAIRRLDDGLGIARKMELSLELEVHHGLGTSLEIASRDGLIGSKLLHKTRIESHALIGLLHGHETLALHADDIGLSRTRLLTTLRENADIHGTRVIAENTLQEVEQNGLAVGTTAGQDVELLGRIAAHKKRRHVLDPELTNLAIRKNALNKPLNLRPADVFRVTLLGVKVNTRRERNVILRTTIAESDTQTAGKRRHVVDSIVERNEIDIVIGLHTEGLIEEELTALLHDIVLELRATEIRADLLKQLLLVEHLAERAAQLGLLMLTLRHLLNSLAEHVLDVVTLDLPDLRRELALKVNPAVRLFPHMAGEAEPHIVRKLGTLVVIAEVGVNHASHVVFRARAGRLNQVDDVVLADLLVSLGVIGLGPEEKRSHTETLAILAKRESVPLLNAVALVELVRAPRGEVEKGIQKIHMNVLQALTDFLPILVIHRTLLAEIVDMCLDEAPLFLVQRTLAGLSTRRGTTGSARLTTNCRTTASGSHCPTARDAIVRLRNLVLHFGGRLGHRRRLIGIGTNRELLDELDGDRGLLRVHCDRTLGLRTDPRNLVRKTARLLGFLEHPLLTVSENGLVLDVLPINDEGETAEELTHSRNE